MNQTPDQEQFRSFREFYPFYLSEHQHPTSRTLHFIGTGLVVVILILAIITGRWWFAIAIPFVGYGFAWLGHLIYEKNKPATFKYPAYSLLSDFRLFFELLTGREKFNPRAK